jgi:hypothetical protein
MIYFGGKMVRQLRRNVARRLPSVTFEFFNNGTG